MIFLVYPHLWYEIETHYTLTLTFCLSPFYVLWGLITKKWLQINIKTMAFFVEAFFTEYQIIHFMRIIFEFTPCHIIDSSLISFLGLRCSRLTLFCQTFLEFKLEIAHVCFWWLYYSIWNCWNNNNLRGQFNMF